MTQVAVVVNRYAAAVHFYLIGSQGGEGFLFTGKRVVNSDAHSKLKKQQVVETGVETKKLTKNTILKQPQ